MKKVAECLYLNESSGTYFALVKRGGKQIRRSLKTQDRKLAERRLKKFRANAGKLTTKVEDRKMLFEELAMRWLKITNAPLKPSTALRYERCVARLEEVFRGLGVAKVNRMDCERWATVRSKSVGARSFNYELQVLKRIFDYAIDIGIVLSNPAESLKPIKQRKKAIVVPSMTEFETLVSTLEQMAKKDKRVRPAISLVRLLAFSGMRVGEATRIVWGEIDFERELFTVSGGDIGTKNGESRVVPLFPVMRGFLEEMIETGAVVGSVSKRSGGPIAVPKPTSRIIRIDSAKKALATACRKAGLPKFGHHCMRHFFVSNAIEKSIDFKVIAEWVGHNDGGKLVSETYGHLRNSHSREMARLMV
ncbi:tyrosine-type recombinase/integrase [Pelagicoccus mobilis]|uniref:Site-specific integrase n=1 Tax=Pelagicoccus mobilis TaxID=415221 RepID=A0A934RWB2_9BACT|nr:site-specific integrase [Pelagicoccus mobilis]MBK1875592.1 site-specific integrase [Pelagicoccus mobilis]